MSLWILKSITIIAVDTWKVRANNKSAKGPPNSKCITAYIGATTPNIPFITNIHLIVVPFFHVKQ